MAASRAAVRGLAGTNLATSVGVRTLPSKRGKTPEGKGNTPARRMWHQGFGVIWQGKVPVVPFIEEATCRRIAADAAEVSSKTIVVSQTETGLWIFREVEV